MAANSNAYMMVPQIANSSSQMRCLSERHKGSGADCALFAGCIPKHAEKVFKWRQQEERCSHSAGKFEQKNLPTFVERWRRNLGCHQIHLWSLGVLLNNEIRKKLKWYNYIWEVGRELTLNENFKCGHYWAWHICALAMFCVQFRAYHWDGAIFIANN